MRAIVAKRPVMSENNKNGMARFVVPGLVGLIGGAAGAAAVVASGVGQGDNVRDYLLSNPEVLPEAIEKLQEKEMQARLDPVSDDLETPFPGAVLGNPEGTLTLVEFSDYACGFCRSSVKDVASLIKDNPDLKVVLREYPILSEQSIEAARMALAAAQQGKFEAFHFAMVEAGRPSPETIEQAARKAEVDLAVARAAIESGELDKELQQNSAIAQSLGIDGTPGWIAGDQLIVGGVGPEALAEFIAEAREAG